MKFFTVFKLTEVFPVIKCVDVIVLICLMRDAGNAKKKKQRRKNLIIYSFFRVLEISGFSFRLYLEDEKQTCDNYPP